MNEHKIASKIASEMLMAIHVAKEFGTKEELEKYLKEHPAADKSKHVVKEKGDSEGSKEDVSPEKSPVHKKVMKKVFDKVKNWAEEEKKFFTEGQELPNSKGRSKIADFMKRKAKGVVKHIKHEVKEWKTAASATKKLISGKKIDEEEKKALKTVATHAALTAGALAMSGGLKPPLPDLVKNFGLHLLEHSILLGAAKVTLFAADADITDDEALEKLVNEMANAMQSADIPPEGWDMVVDKINEGR